MALNAVRLQEPQVYEQLSLHFSDSFRRTQQGLTAYILNTRDKDRAIKAILLKIFDKAFHLNKTIPKPEMLGLMDTNAKRSWSAEFFAVFGAMVRNGSEQFREAQLKHLGIAKAAIKNAKAEIKSYPFWNSKKYSAKRKLNRSRARYSNHVEMLRKIDYINSFFF